MDTILFWFSDKFEPEVKTLPSGVKILSFKGSMNSYEYQLWVDSGKKTEKPANRYLYVTFTSFDEPSWDHVHKIREWSNTQKPEGDPRSDAVAIGKWGKSVEVNGKNYADFTLREISRCVWGPMAQRGNKE
jgi:hypothetical protein